MKIIVRILSLTIIKMQFVILVRIHSVMLIRIISRIQPLKLS